MHASPDLREFQETCLRMEAKYLPGSPFRLRYERLCRRFQDGLGDERDRLIKFIEEDGQGRID